MASNMAHSDRPAQPSYALHGGEGSRSATPATAAMPVLKPVPRGASLPPGTWKPNSSHPLHGDVGQYDYTSDQANGKGSKTCWFPFKQQYKKRRRRHADVHLVHDPLRPQPLVFRLKSTGPNGQTREERVQAFEYHNGADNGNDNATTASEQQVGATELVLGGGPIASQSPSMSPSKSPSKSQAQMQALAASPDSAMRRRLNDTATTADSFDAFDAFHNSGFGASQDTDGDDNSIADFSHSKQQQQQQQQRQQQHYQQQQQQQRQRANYALANVDANCATKKFWIDEVVDSTGWNCMDDGFPAPSRSAANERSPAPSWKPINGLVKSPHLQYDGDRANASTADPNNTNDDNTNIVFRDSFLDDLMVFQHEIFEEQARDGMMSLAGSIDESMPVPQCGDENDYFDERFAGKCAKKTRSPQRMKYRAPSNAANYDEEKKDEFDGGADTNIEHGDGTDPIFSVEVEHAPDTAQDGGDANGSNKHSKKTKKGILGLFSKLHMGRKKGHADKNNSDLTSKSTLIHSVNNTDKSTIVEKNKVVPVPQRSLSSKAATKAGKRTSTRASGIASGAATVSTNSTSSNSNSNGGSTSDRMRTPTRGANTSAGGANRFQRTTSNGTRSSGDDAASANTESRHFANKPKTHSWGHRSLMDDDEQSTSRGTLDDSGRSSRDVEDTASESFRRQATQMNTRINSTQKFKITMTGEINQIGGFPEDNIAITNRSMSSTPQTSFGLGQDQRQLNAASMAQEGFKEEIETMDYTDAAQPTQATDETNPELLLQRMTAMSFSGANGSNGNTAATADANENRKTTPHHHHHHQQQQQQQKTASARSSKKRNVSFSFQKVFASKRPQSQGSSQPTEPELNVNSIPIMIRDDQSETGSDKVNTGAEEPSKDAAAAVNAAAALIENKGKSNSAARFSRNSSVLAALNRAHEMAANSLPEAHAVERCKSEFTLKTRERSLLDDSRSNLGPNGSPAVKRTKSTSMLKREEFQENEFLSLERQTTTSAVQRDPSIVDSLDSQHKDNYKEFKKFLEDDFALVRRIPSKIEMPSSPGGSGQRSVIYSPSRRGKNKMNMDENDSWMDDGSGIRTETFQEYEEEDSLFSDLRTNGDHKSKGSMTLSKQSASTLDQSELRMLRAMRRQDGQLTTFSDALFDEDKFGCIDKWIDV